MTAKVLNYLPNALHFGKFVLCLVIVNGTSTERVGGEELRVVPNRIELLGHDAGAGVLVDLLEQTIEMGPRYSDVTGRAIYHSSDPNVFTVDRHGVVRSQANGQGTLTVEYAEHRKLVPVVVRAAGVRRNYHFERDIIPLLSKFRCNSSGCHGKAEGQNGLKLSVFGFDPAADHDALTKEGRGRRTNTAAPLSSLLITKASGGLPHGGGVRIVPGSREYTRLSEWIQAGTPVGDDDAPMISRIELQPQDRPLEMKWQQQLRVKAVYTDGSTEDVTSTATYQVNNDGLASVDSEGLITIGEHPGQVAVMASYMGQVATFKALIPQQVYSVVDAEYRVRNAIDHQVNRQLRRLRIVPSPRATDAEFMRRVYLDVIGTLPTAVEAESFLTSEAVDKRQRLVDQLLNRPEYADLWSLRWADVLRVDRQSLGHKNAQSYYRWIRTQFAQNRPFDEFAHEIVSAAGLLAYQPAGHFYQVVKTPGERASTLSQVFLGVRIACAECHHHPFDRWSQTDYYGMAAYFQGVSTKTTARGPLLTVGKTASLPHPRTRAPIAARPLASEALTDASDPRRGLADWMIDPNNPYFARAAVNRVWAKLLGRGLVEPVDDFRDTNPPSNSQLLDVLAEHLVQSKYDMHALIRFITNSETYQRSSTPNKSNFDDEGNYSRGLLKRMDAEVLYDAINQVAGAVEKFRGVPHGSRAIQLWDSEVQHDFLGLFGRPQRKTSCECERVGQVSVGQVLHVLNSPEIEAKLRHPQGLVLRLTKQHSENGELTTALYLTFFGRLPSPEELDVGATHLGQSADRSAAAVDLSWALLNSLEFLFNH